MFKPSAIALALSLILFSTPQQAEDQRVIVTNKGLPPGQQSPPEKGAGGDKDSSSSTQPRAIKKIDLPDMGDSSGTLISPAEEKEFGEEFFRSLHAQITINQDAEIQEYIQSIGQKLAANSDAPSHPFHFFVVMEHDINAFAGPGGYIGVNSGLITMTEAESELASVMAHEISHVTQRHLFRAAEAAGRLTIPSAAGMLAAILLGSQSPQMGQAAIMAIMGGSIQFQINFTRENEEEADDDQDINNR